MLTKIIRPTFSNFVIKNTSLSHQFSNYGNALYRNITTTGIGSNMDLPRRFNNKVAIVTASSYGFGRSMARRLYLEGANVVICSRKQENVDEAVKEIMQSCQEQLSAIDAKNSVSGIVCHVGNAEHRRNLIDFTLQKYGQIDCFVSNAGVNPHVGPTEAITEKQMDKIFDTNFKAVVFLTQLLLPHLRQSSLRAKADNKLPDAYTKNKDKVVVNGRGASVVFISSIAARCGLENLGVYAASKAGLISLSRVLARECAVDNIRFNCVSPGPFETKFGTILKEEHLFADLGGDTIMNRFGQQHELDGIVAYLLSDEASYITGETINVAGGLR